MMAPPEDTLIHFYNEAVIQLGFIVFFACVFPLAPLFSLLTNMLEIRIKLNSMSLYSRRFPAKGANGIGSWAGIMELISLVSIPINFAILYFATKGGYLSKDAEVRQSETVEYLMVNSPGSTLLDTVLVMVLLEHILLAVKVMMAELIPDVPESVIKDETKRPKIQALAQAEMADLKRDNDLKDIEEIMEEIAKEDKQKVETKVQAVLKRERDRNVNLDP